MEAVGLFSVEAAMVVGYGRSVVVMSLKVMGLKA
jgi:hypothetical protein